jgi:hypothetical protein
MREFIILFTVLILLGTLMALVAKTAVAFNLAFLLPFIYAIPFFFMAYGNLRDARTLQNLTVKMRTVYRIRAIGFLLVTVPFFFKPVLPLFYLYSLAIFVLNIVITGVLENKDVK